MINYAGRNPLINTNSALPNMSNTITSWFLDISFEVVERTLEGADWVETVINTIHTKGVVQPPRDRDLAILPEGTWAWSWLMIHCLPDVQLNTNQYIIYDGTLYKVMSKKDWSKYGYVRYTILQAYQADKL